MIEHHPYGIDDPYKRWPTERFPRDPEPGDPVQIAFRVQGARAAWVEWDEDGVRCSAVDLGDGLWSAQCPAVEAGCYSYVIKAQTPSGLLSSERFNLEVGEWYQVGQVEEIQLEPGQVTVVLSAPNRPEPAALRLSFPIAGVCKAEFVTRVVRGDAAGLPLTTSQPGDILEVSADGIKVQLNLKTLDLGAFLPGQLEPLFTGSARFRWLEGQGGFCSKLEGSFFPQGEALYGLGERFNSPDQRGRKLDVRVYEEYKEQGNRSYLPVPLVVSSKGYGVWLEADEPSYFDLSSWPARITLDKLPTRVARFPLHLMVAARPYQITAAFTRLTGAIAVPPKWALGPWMSSNTWNTQARAEAAVERTLAEDVPATVLVLEAWSDESTFYIFNDAQYTPKPGSEAFRLADFSFGGRWPDPKAMVEACHQQGLRVILWQIPVQKKNEVPHPQHDADEAHMLERGFGIQNADGSPYRCQGWWFTGGLVMDFSNPQARDWWFDKRRYLLEELGIDGMKTDGGEHLWGRDLRSYGGKRGLELYNTYPNEYVGAYHRFIQEHTGGDGLTFSRSGYTGAQRFPAHWAGDENSTWSAFRASIWAGLSAGISGVSLWGWDIGGFSGEIPSVELYLRSVAMACFCPIMQYHSEYHTVTENRDRSPWNIAERHADPKALEVYRCYAKLRMRLLDYLYEEAQATSAAGIPLMRYPALEYPQTHDFLAQDPFAYLFGRDLLVCPVVEKGALAREVRLPPGEWVELWSGATLGGERVLNVPALLERIPVFVRADSPRLEFLLEVSRGFKE